MRRARWLLLFLLVLLLAGAWMVRNWRFSSLSTADLERVPIGPVTGQVLTGDQFAANARVRFKGDVLALLTDAEGRFSLPRRPAAATRVTAWKDGYFIGGTEIGLRPLRLTLQPLPREDCERYTWVEPTPNPARSDRCGNCHPEIYREWAASGHARSAKGRHFLNLYEGSDWHGKPGVGWSLLDQYPDGAGVCTACHAPTVADNDPAYFDLRKAQGVAGLGVHCDYCHKITDAGLGEIGLTHGRFGLKLLRPAEGQLFFGPLDDVDRGEDTYSPLYRESRYCASCHEGTVFGVHVYSTYSEWLASPARQDGLHCQSCHMAPTGLMTNIAPGHGGIERDRWSLGNHRFLENSPQEMLRRCLRIAVNVKRAANDVRAEVELTVDNVGHRVPTGYIDRHLLLVVRGIGANGQLLRALDGPLLPTAAGKELKGESGRVYGKLLKDAEGQSPAPFWRAVPVVTDTRLAPRQPDQSLYQFPAGVEQVRVQVIYRRFWQEVAESKQWLDNETIVIDRTATVPR